MLKLWKNKGSLSHEELFLTYYSKLLTWAMQLTGQDRSKAEDLVHDVFIHFVFVEPELSEVENLEGYLFAMMRNLLRSQMRRQSVALNNQLSLLDYDSAELGLRARDLRQDVRVREELEMICHYACVRKETSRAGSALILRFYLGYYPVEISQILKSSRQAVADLLGAARREARVYLTHPNRLTFMNTSSQRLRVKTLYLTEEDFLLELRRAIFRSCGGVCVPTRRLKDAYRSDSGTASLEIEELGHLVSCPRCLDIVNHQLGLALLADRHPADTIGPDPGGRGDGGSPPGGATGAKDAIKRFRRRLKDVFEHEPRELHIAVNGRILASQSINSDLSRQNLLVDTTEKLEFVEVFSEQGVRLLSMGVDPPPTGPFEQQSQVGFSENRSLNVSISFNGPSPSLEVVYRDPGFRPSVLAVTAASPIHGEVTGAVLPARTETPGDPTAKEEMSLGPGISLIGSFRDLIVAGTLMLRSRRALVTALASAILIAAYLLFRSSAPAVSAAELLQRSADAEARFLSDPSVVVHRAFSLSVRTRGDARLLARQRIETWQSQARGLKVRRLFDEQDKLIAGEWRKSDGSAVVYRSGLNIETRASSEGTSISIDSAWLNELNAKDFTKLTGAGANQSVREENDHYIISSTPVLSRSFNEPESGSITLNRSDLRALEQILVIRTSQGPVELHFAETQFERRTLLEVAPLIFEPDAVFFRTPLLVEPALVTASPAPSPVPPPPAVATAELEIEALSLLDHVGATLGEEVSVSRTVDGVLQIAGVVEGRERKEAILAALAPLATHPAARLMIETSEEAQVRLEKTRQPSETRAIQIQEATPTTGTIAVDRELRGHLALNGTPDARLDEEVNQYANQALQRSRQAMLHAWALRKLVQRFSTDEVQSLDKNSRTKWLTLIVQHTQGFERETTGLRAHLILAFPAKAAADETVTDVTDEAGLARLILRMAELSTITDEAIRSSFTLSGGDGLAVSSAPFWRTLSNAELLAQKIEQGAQAKATPLRNSR
jgi:RNA polymerase sigma factor (sigma-70 family)